MDWEFLEKVKIIAIKALVSDDELFDRLVLKGGSALDLIYKISERASIDLDFSIEESFDDSRLLEMESKIRILLETAFKENKYIAYDIKLVEKPKNLKSGLESFWGGYKIEFKIISIEFHEKFKEDIDSLRRNSINVGKNNSTIFRIEISKFEYCQLIEDKKIDGYTVKVYSPTLIAIEKLRAICQQMEDYKQITFGSRTARARDFFDIYTIIKTCDIDLLTPKNREIIKTVFDAKKVPMNYLKKIEENREFHRDDFRAVRDTIKAGIQLEEFDYYFDFVKSICDKL